MRDIKFRGEAILVDGSNRFVYGYLIDSKARKEYYIMTNINDFPIPIREETIAQYTGIKDRNGVEIYEGDTINIYNWGKPYDLIHTGEVYWNKDEARFDIDPYIDVELYDLWSKAGIEVVKENKNGK